MEIKRQNNLDIARSFAILAVILCHSVEYGYSAAMQDWEKLRGVNQIFRSMAYTTGRLGVPIFLFLTGYLLLNKHIKSPDDIMAFYKNKLFPIFLTYEIWILLYQLFLCVLNHSSFNISNYLLNASLIKGNGMIHVWYMPLIIGIYVTLPILAYVLRFLSLKLIFLLCLLSFVFNMLIPNIFRYIAIINDEAVEEAFYNVGFLGDYYGLYIILGFLCSKKFFSKISSIILGIVLFLCIGLMVFYQISLNTRGFYFDVWYDFGILLVAGICLFELFIRIPNEKIPNWFIKITSFLSRISLGLYFLHMPFLIIISDVLDTKKKLPINYTGVYLAISFSASIITSSILIKNKKIGRYLFLYHNEEKRKI